VRAAGVGLVGVGRLRLGGGAVPCRRAAGVVGGGRCMRDVAPGRAGRGRRVGGRRAPAPGRWRSAMPACRGRGGRWPVRAWRAPARC
jgi:hypothetical protein